MTTYAYRTTTAPVVIHIDEHFHSLLQRFDKDENNNERMHTRYDRKSQYGKCPVSFQEIPEYDVDSWRTVYTEIVRDTANYTTGETVIIEREERAERQELISRMLSAIETLPPKRKEYIKAVYFGGYTKVDYARSVGCSPRNVRSSIQKGLASLCKMLVTNSDATSCKGRFSSI